MRFASYQFHGRRFLHPEPLPLPTSTRLSPFSSISRLGDFDTPKLEPMYSFSTKLQTFLQGKLLLLHELSFSMETIHDHYRNGYVSYMKAILEIDGHFYCRRCGNQKQRLFGQFSCARCLQTCVYCRQCVLMGRVSECTPLIYWTGPKRPLQKVTRSLQWRGELSRPQAKAAQAVTEAMGKAKEMLVWAVSGAGKTEILYQGLEKAFAFGKRVCLATPRVDVVTELLPRFKQAFPAIAIRGLYSGSEDRDDDVGLVIATTHQLLRSRARFDVMVVDEVDAFPYSFDPMLQFAVARARCQSATTIYLTATPNDQYKRQVKEGKLACVKIPLRHHGHLLPVPELKWCGNWRRRLQKQTLPNPVVAWIKGQFARSRQAFLFVPSVNILQEIAAIVEQTFPRVEAVHAEDTYRQQKVANFRAGVTRILVTTTILERGVTIPDIDVAVVGAEEAIFTESALVQMAGRVGRSADFPTGKVTFFHYGKTKAMIAAIRHIEEMNREARSAQRSE